MTQILYDLYVYEDLDLVSDQTISIDESSRKKALASRVKDSLLPLVWRKASSTESPRFKEPILCLDDTGSLLAIVHEQNVLFRFRDRDDFASTQAVWRGPPDLQNLPRFASWSPQKGQGEETDESQDDKRFAVSIHHKVYVMDAEGRLLFVVDTAQNVVTEMQGSSSGLDESGERSPSAFRRILGLALHEDEKTDSLRLIVLFANGELSCYPLTSSTPATHGSISLTAFHRAVTCIAYNRAHSCIAVAAVKPQKPPAAAESSADQSGEQDQQQPDPEYEISLWRIISQSPYFEPWSTIPKNTSGDFSEKSTSITGGLLQKVLAKVYTPNLSVDESLIRDRIKKLAFSPDGGYIAGLTARGTVIVWETPFPTPNRTQLIDGAGSDEEEDDESEKESAIRFRGKTAERNGGGDSAKSPTLTVPGGEVGKLDNSSIVVTFYGPDFPTDAFNNTATLADFSWWSPTDLILTRHNGELCIMPVDSKRNLLGPSPEIFKGAPIVTDAHNGSFFVLEHETEDLSSNSESGEKVVRKRYRLVGVSETTPEDLMQAKVAAREYGSALGIAKAFGLCPDMIYQSQWLSFGSNIGVQTIKRYLDKVSDREWILEQCATCVPSNVEIAGTLLSYGLELTQSLLKTYYEESQREEGGKGASQGSDEMNEIVGDDGGEEEEEEIPPSVVLRFLTEPSELSPEVRMYCGYRYAFLQFLDRLQTFQELASGFSPNEFQIFRKCNLRDRAIMLAQREDFKTLKSLLCCHTDELYPHLLEILSSIPGTCSPSQFSQFLPPLYYIDSKGQFQSDLDLETWREEHDPVESKNVLSQLTPYIRDPESGASTILRESCENLFLEVPPEEHVENWQANVTWLIRRAHEIDRSCGMVDKALEVVEKGLRRLEAAMPHTQTEKSDELLGPLRKVRDDLRSLSVLVYECADASELSNDDPFLSISLEAWESMPDFERLSLLLERGVTEINVSEVMRRRALPFLEATCAPEVCSSLIMKYLLGLAPDRLPICAQAIWSSRPSSTERILTSDEELMKCGLDCAYACTRTDQWSSMTKIFESFPERGDVTVATAKERNQLAKLHDRVDTFEAHLMAAKLLSEYNVPQRLDFFLTCETKPDECETILRQISRQAIKSSPPYTEAKWRNLLSDMTEMREKGFPFLSESVVYSLFCEALLAAGCFSLAKEQLSNAVRSRVLTDSQSEDLILTAARDYINSAVSASDEALKLAETCLNLNPNPSSSSSTQNSTSGSGLIQSELNLICAVRFLWKEYVIQLLPVQIRLTKNRMSIVRQTLESHSKAHINESSIMTLCDYLGLSSPAQHNEARLMMADRAFELNDRESCAKHCKALASTAPNFSPVWSVCLKLGLCEEYQDVTTRLYLLSVAMAHCPSESLSIVLRCYQELESRVACESVLREMTPKESTSASRSGGKQLLSILFPLSSSLKPSAQSQQKLVVPIPLKDFATQVLAKFGEENATEGSLKRALGPIAEALQPFSQPKSTDQAATSPQTVSSLPLIECLDVQACLRCLAEANGGADLSEIPESQAFVVHPLFESVFSFFKPLHCSSLSGFNSFLSPQKQTSTQEKDVAWSRVRAILLAERLSTINQSAVELETRETSNNDQVYVALDSFRRDILLFLSRISTLNVEGSKAVFDALLARGGDSTEFVSTISHLAAFHFSVAHLSQNATQEDSPARVLLLSLTQPFLLSASTPAGSKRSAKSAKPTEPTSECQSQISALLGKVPMRLIIEKTCELSSGEGFAWLNEAKRYWGMLQEMEEANTIKAHFPQVDVCQFAIDPKYREEAVRGIFANPLSTELIEIALEFTARHGISKIDALLDYAEATLSTTTISPETAKDRIAHFQKSLLADPAKAAEGIQEILSKGVLVLSRAIIALELLISALHSVSPSTEKVQDALQAADSNFSLLKKISPIHPHLPSNDVSLLIGTRGPLDTRSLLSVLDGHLTSDNVRPWLKVIKKMELTQPLTEGQLYTRLILRSIFSKPPQETLPSFREQIGFLKPEDLVSLAQDITTYQDFSLLPVSARLTFVSDIYDALTLSPEARAAKAHASSDGQSEQQQQSGSSAPSTPVAATTKKAKQKLGAKVVQQPAKQSQQPSEKSFPRTTSPQSHSVACLLFRLRVANLAVLTTHGLLPQQGPEVAKWLNGETHLIYLLTRLPIASATILETTKFLSALKACHAELFSTSTSQPETETEISTPELIDWSCERVYVEAVAMLLPVLVAEPSSCASETQKLSSPTFDPNSLQYDILAIEQCSAFDACSALANVVRSADEAVGDQGVSVRQAISQLLESFIHETPSRSLPEPLLRNFEKLRNSHMLPEFQGDITQLPIPVQSRVVVLQLAKKFGGKNLSGVLADVNLLVFYKTVQLAKDFFGISLTSPSQIGSPQDQSTLFSQILEKCSKALSKVETENENSGIPTFNAALEILVQWTSAHENQDHLAEMCAKLLSCAMISGRADLLSVVQKALPEDVMTSEVETRATESLPTDPTQRMNALQFLVSSRHTSQFERAVQELRQIAKTEDSSHFSEDLLLFLVFKGVLHLFVDTRVFSDFVEWVRSGFSQPKNPTVFKSVCCHSVAQLALQGMPMQAGTIALEIFGVPVWMRSPQMAFAMASRLLRDCSSAKETQKSEKLPLDGPLLSSLSLSEADLVPQWKKALGAVAKN